MEILFSQGFNNSKIIIKMKKIVLITMVIIGLNHSYGQVAIGKNSITNSSVILEFADATTNGINLPLVATLPVAGALVNGTILLDRNDSKVKWCANGAWVDLTGTGNVTLVSPTPNPSVDTGGGTIIGATSSLASGAMVLESTNKALILPKVTDPHTNVKSPIAGMMVYDTTSKSVAVFNGTNWSYWE